MVIEFQGLFQMIVNNFKRSVMLFEVSAQNKHRPHAGLHIMPIL